jgi:Phytanoyl-CoA dioxygenase (PhyH)
MCRTENVSACHDGFRWLVDGPLAELAAESWGVARATITDFKDKLNFKPPGGAGFGVHQDLAAYPGATRVVSLLVAIDECSVTSGCLWLAPDVGELLPTDARGVVTVQAAASLRWSAAELRAGDALCIDGLAPHFSETNRSGAPRRVFIASYAPVADGYGRKRYYRARAQAMADAGDDTRISTLADFQGLPASTTGSRIRVPAGDGCCHRRARARARERTPLSDSPPAGWRSPPSGGNRCST